MTSRANEKAASVAAVQEPAAAVAAPSVATVAAPAAVAGEVQSKTQDLSVLRCPQQRLKDALDLASRKILYLFCLLLLWYYPIRIIYRIIDNLVTLTTYYSALFLFTKKITPSLWIGPFIRTYISPYL